MGNNFRRRFVAKRYVSVRLFNSYSNFLTFKGTTSIFDFARNYLLFAGKFVKYRLNVRGPKFFGFFKKLVDALSGSSLYRGLTIISLLTHRFKLFNRAVRNKSRIVTSWGRLVTKFISNTYRLRLNFRYNRRSKFFRKSRGRATLKSKVSTNMVLGNLSSIRAKGPNLRAAPVLFFENVGALRAYRNR